MASPRLILASASPRRQQLLAQIGITPDAILPADIDETPGDGELPRDLAARLAFPASPAWENDLSGPRNVDDDYFAYHILNCRGMSLGGGTDEIQRNTLGERALGLPREPGPDRNTPFRDLMKN